jgi:hypothetical protein
MAAMIFKGPPQWGQWQLGYAEAQKPYSHRPSDLLGFIVLHREAEPPLHPVEDLTGRGGQVLGCG